MNKKITYDKGSLIVSLVFIAAYALALLLDAANLSIIAGGMLIMTALSLYIAIALYSHHPADIRALLSLGWIVGLGFGIMKLSTYHYDWTWQSKICFGGFYVLYMLFSGIKTEDGGNNRKVIIYDLKKMYIAVIVMCAVSLFAFTLEAVILGYIPMFSKETHAYNYFHISGVHYFTVSAIFTHCFSVTYLIELKKQKKLLDKRKKPVLICANLLSLAVNLMCLGKLNIILSIVFPVLIVLGQVRVEDYKKLAWKKIIAVFLISVVMVAGVFVLFTKLRHYEPGYLDEIFAFKNTNTPIWFQYPYMYIANNYANFNYLTMCIEKYSFGLKELFPVFALTGLKFKFAALLTFPAYFMKIEMNTLTIIYDAYYDFGIAGVFLFGALFGLVSGTITKKTQEKSPVGMLIYSQIAVYAMLSFFSAWFSVPTTWFWIALIIIYGVFIRERK